MQITQPVWVIGLMSGTSLDGVDAALIRTDGEHVAECGATFSLPYSTAFRNEIYALLKGEGDVAAVTRSLTERHAEAVETLLAQAGMKPREVALIGFHGQTIWHKPHEGKTCQIGDAALLAARSGIPVVYDFRSNDMAHGGQGAPFVPLYHAALAEALAKPLAVVNIGGVANITWMDAHHIIAFDCGMGNALMDDTVHTHTGATYDANGAIAATGKVDEQRLSAALAHPFFVAPAPKSLDRLDFTMHMVDGLPLADALATLAAFTVQGIARGLALMPHMPARVLITGGGRHNPTLMRMLIEVLPQSAVEPVEAVTWNGDMLEAQAFGFLAVRSVRGLPLSLPSTTGVRMPVSGGKFQDCA
jgi:anhydro-N-acetylmuramic acid kinase